MTRSVQHGAPQANAPQNQTIHSKQAIGTRSKSPIPLKTIPMGGKARVKLCWGSEIRVVQLPPKPQVAQLYALMRDEFGHDNFEVRCEPSPYWKMAVRCISARHLPKADRAGLCDAYCDISVEHKQYSYTGFSATPNKLRTKVIKKSLAPSWDELLSVIVDGSVDPKEVGPPRLVVKVKDWDASGNPDGNLLGVVTLDIGELAAKQARLGQLQRIEAKLRQSLVRIEQEMKAVMHKPADYRARQKHYQQVEGLVEHLMATQKKLGAWKEEWHTLRWAPGCTEASKVLSPEGEECVRGADWQFASIKLALIPQLSDYHANCFLNAYYEEAFNCIDAARGELGEATDDYLEWVEGKVEEGRRLLAHKSHSSASNHFLSLRVRDAAHRASILRVHGEARRRYLNFCGLSGRLIPGLPMTQAPATEGAAGGGRGGGGHSTCIESTQGLQGALQEWAEFHEGGPLRVQLVGDLRVRVVACRQLPLMDHVHLSSAYVKVVCGAREKRSSVRHKNLNPTWPGRDGERISVEVLEPADELYVELWDMSELRVYDAEAKRNTVSRIDEFIGCVNVPRLTSIFHRGSTPLSFLPVIGKDGQAVTGHTPPGQELSPDPLTRVQLQIEAVPQGRARDEDGGGEEGAREVGAEDGEEEGEDGEGGTAAAETQLLELFLRFAREGRQLDKALKDSTHGQQGTSSSSRKGDASGSHARGLQAASEVLQGDRVYLMDLQEFLALLRELQLLPQRLDKGRAAALFEEARKAAARHKDSARDRSRQRDRELDWPEFLQVCEQLAAMFGRSLQDIADGAAEWADQPATAPGSRGTTAGGGSRGGRRSREADWPAEWAEGFPMHAAAAGGDVKHFLRVWGKLRRMEVRAEQQLQGASRDLLYLTERMLKRHRERAFRVTRSERRPPPPLWNQSSSNRGLANAVDPGGWTCLHHAVARGHLEMAWVLVKSGWWVDRPNSHWLRTAMHLAVERGDPDMVRLLLQLGGSWTVMDKEGVTPLAVAPTELFEAMERIVWVLDPERRLLPAMPEDPRGCSRETISLWRRQAVFPARPGKCKFVLLGSPPAAALEFPWQQGKPGGGASEFEIITREFDVNSGRRPAGDIKDATTNGGFDMPLTVLDHNMFRALAEERGMQQWGPRNTMATRNRILGSLRRVFRMGEEVDVVYVVYSGYAQKHTGRWVCVDGFVDLLDVMALWREAKQQRDASTTRLVIISDSPGSGVWTDQLRLMLGCGDSSLDLHFPYTTADPSLRPPPLRASSRSRSRSRSPQKRAGAGAVSAAAAGGEGASGSEAGQGTDGAAGRSVEQQESTRAEGVAGDGPGKHGGASGEGAGRSRQGHEGHGKEVSRREEGGAEGGGRELAEGGNAGDKVGPGQGGHGEGERAPRGNGRGRRGSLVERGFTAEVPRWQSFRAAAQTVAVMSSCGRLERSMETALGGNFTRAWATNPVQGRLSLNGMQLASPPLKLVGAGCRQHPSLCVGWVETPISRDPRLVHAGVGLYLMGSPFFQLNSGSS